MTPQTRIRLCLLTLNLIVSVERPVILLRMAPVTKRKVVRLISAPQKTRFTAVASRDPTAPLNIMASRTPNLPVDKRQTSRYVTHHCLTRLKTHRMPLRTGSTSVMAPLTQLRNITTKPQRPRTATGRSMTTVTHPCVHMRIQNRQLILLPGHHSRNPTNMKQRDHHGCHQ